jgi:hypothetical protein
MGFNVTENINNIINVNDARFSKKNFKLNIPETEVERIADKLVDKLGYPLSKPYYCKVARLIPENTLERFADTEKEVGRNGGRLFTFLTKKEISKLYPNGEQDD